MSTQKDLIHYTLMYYIAQRAGYLARVTGVPTASVRRVLAELVAAGRATYVKKDLFGAPGYLAVKQSRASRRAS